MAQAEFQWPAEGLARIPDWVYTSAAIYEREVARIFHGRTWNYVALEAEIPKQGDFKRSFVGPTPVVVARGPDGAINVFENRCAHRGSEFCQDYRGNVGEFVCPYHQWTYDLAGRLVGVPFRRGVKGEGGMPASFRLDEHGPRRLAVATRRGVVFASFAADMEPLEDYLGPEILADFDATFDGRTLRILGYYRNTVPANWKMYHENLKDPYHATLLAFLSRDVRASGRRQQIGDDRRSHRPPRHDGLGQARQGRGRCRQPARDARLPRQSAARRPAHPRLRARVPIAVVGDDADDLAQHGGAARAQHARHAPDRAQGPARIPHDLDHVRLRGRQRGNDAPSPAPGQSHGSRRASSASRTTRR